LSTQENGIPNFLRIILPPKQEEYAIDLWQRTERKLGHWIQGQLLLSVIIGTLTYIGLLIFGVKYAFVLALITAFFELIPFGLILAIVPAVIIAYVDGGISLGFITLALYLIIQQFETYLIQPFVVKKIVGISPLMVIISIVIGSQLAGFWGVILAVPVAVCVLEFMDDVEKRKRSVPQVE
jgi:predicted PurR-regulated permease PerM